MEGFVLLDEASIRLTRDYTEGGVYFRMSVSHGENPTNAGYAYVQLPLATKEETLAFANSDSVKVLQNDVKAHAVYDKETGLLGANVFEANVTIDGITFHTPCSVIVDEVNGKMYISNPNREHDLISITLPEDWSNVTGEDLVTETTRSVSNDILLDVSVRRGSTHIITFTSASVDDDSDSSDASDSSDTTDNSDAIDSSDTTDSSDNSDSSDMSDNSHDTDNSGNSDYSDSIENSDADDSTNETDDADNDSTYNNSNVQATSSATTTSTAATGDNSSLLTWCMLVIIALVAAVGLINVKRKEK